MFNTELFSEAVMEKMFAMQQEQKRRIGLREFATQSGISAPTLSRVFHGKNPDIETFFALCKWMNRSANDFKTKTDE
jgi:transcriptional regulator with XRE-family HTH domain